MKITGYHVGGASSAIIIACALAVHFEGFTPTPALDPVGILSNCYGNTHGVVAGKTMTKAQCDALLQREMGASLAELDRETRVSLTDNQRAAFADFIYNTGAGTFEKSTLLKKLKKGDTIGACNELPRYVYGRGGVKLGGLVARRKAEQDICLGR